MNPLQLNIANSINKKYALSEDDARVLVPALDDAIKHRSEVQVSFSGIEGVSTLFLRTLLGEFYLTYGTEVDHFIHFTDLSADDVISTQLERLRKRALSPEVYRPIFDNAIGGA